MQALLLIAKAEWRTRWWSLLLLGVIAGLAGGTVAASATVARRTATADERLAEATNADDVRSIIFGGNATATRRIGERVLALPGVESGRIALGGVARVEHEGIVYVGVVIGPQRWGTDLLSPVISEGRLPRPDRANEVVLNEATVSGREGLPVAVGDQLTLHFLTAEEFASFDAAVPLEGRAGTQRVNVVGRVRLPGGPDDLPPFIASPALAAAQPIGIGVLGIALADLEPGADADRYAEQVNDTGRDIARTVEEQPPVSVIGTAEQTRSATRTTTGVLTNGLLLIALVAAVVGSAAVVQASLRHHAAGAVSQRIEAAIGLSPSSRSLARLLAATPALAVATAATVAGGLTAAAVSPPGGLRQVEPHPGWSPNIGLTASVAAAVTVVLLAAVWLGSARALRHRTARSSRDGSVVERVAAHTGRIPVALGLRFALGRPSGRSSATGRAVAVTVALAVTGILAAATYSASLHRVVTTPLRYGYVSDLVIADAGPEVVAELGRDPRFDLVIAGQSVDVVIDGSAAPAVSMVAKEGTLEWELASGRPPATDTEIVLGTRIAQELHKGTGDAVEVQSPTGTRHQLSVVGVGVVPNYGGSGLGRASALTPGGLDTIGGEAVFGELGLGLAPGVQLQATAEELSRTYEVQGVELPRDVANLEQIDRVPQAMVLFLVLLGIATLAHGITASTRRNRRELAIVRALGLLGSQVRSIVLVMGLTAALVGIVVAVPLGVALGGTVWRLVAEGAAVLGDPDLPWPAIVLSLPAAAAAGLLVALVPSVRAGRRPLADDLHGE